MELKIFDYFDYRLFMAEWFQAKKLQNRHFSYRSFAQKAGIKSASLYIDVVKGLKNLSPEKLDAFMVGMQLSPKEEEYFRLLVLHNQCQDPVARDELFSQLSHYFPRRLRALRQSQHQYFSNWQLVAIRESLSVLKIRADDAGIESLGQFFEPPLKKSAVKSALEMLKTLEMIQVNSEGYWTCVDPMIQPGHQCPVNLIRDFQKQMMQRAQIALDTISPAERHITSTTFSVSNEGMQRIAARAEQFRKEVLDIIRTDRSENQVAQFNLQIFPLTARRDAQ